MATKANIGQLIVSIIARTNQFESGTKRAGKSLGILEGQMKGAEKVVGNLTKALGAVGVAFSAGALVSKFNQTAASLDSLAKTSAKIGVLPEKLAALQFAGEQTGVSADTMANAMTKLQIRTSEAAIGAGEAVNVFKELGLRANDLKKLSPDEQFRQIAIAMQGVEGQSDKMRIATKLFEEEGVALVNTLALGEKGLREMEAQAKSLGIAISAEELAKVEAYNDAMNRLSKLIGGFTSKIVIDIAPAATKAIDDLSAAVEGMRIGSGGGKKGESFARSQFRWTMGIADWLQENVIEPRTNKAIRRDLKQGVAAGTAAPDVVKMFGVRGLALAHAAQPGFNPDDVQRAFDSANIIEKNQQARRDRDPIRKGLLAGSRALDDFANKKLPDAWKSLGRFGNEAEHWLKKQDMMFRSPSQETLDKRARMRALFDERRERMNRPDMPEQMNAALLKGTVEAWQAVRQNLVPKQQLDEAKRHTSLLTDIRDRVGQNVIVEAGL